MPERLKARTLVLMPCMNEAGRIGPVVRSVRETLPDADVIVVDDASSDHSADEARAAGAAVLSHGCNLGYGAGLETGYLFAVRNDYDVVLQMDADGQHLASQLPALLGPIDAGTADLVLGSRYRSASGMMASSWLRRLGAQIFSGMIFGLTRLRLSDPTSGFQAMNRRVLNLYASGVFPYDYPDSDVLIMASLSGLRIREVPVIMKERAGGKSMHSGLKPFYYSIKMLLSTFIVLLNYPLWRKWRRLSAKRV